MPDGRCPNHGISEDERITSNPTPSEGWPNPILFDRTAVKLDNKSTLIAPEERAPDAANLNSSLIWAGLDVLNMGNGMKLRHGFTWPELEDNELGGTFQLITKKNAQKTNMRRTFRELDREHGAPVNAIGNVNPGSERQIGRLDSRDDYEFIAQ